MWQNLGGMLTVMAVVAAQLRLLAAWRFQEHLSLTPNAVLAAVPDLTTLMLIATFVIPALAGWGNLLLGSTYVPFSTYWGSVRFLLTLFATGEHLHPLAQHLTPSWPSSELPALGDVARQLYQHAAVAASQQQGVTRL